MSNVIPDGILERHIGILGKTGSGKSNTAKVLAERIMHAGGRVCIIDPTGTWWGIRLRPDGLGKSKFEPIIFGGNHADIPISGEHGALIAEAIATASSSAIIDTRLMTVGARTKFFTAFAEALLRHNRGQLHLIIDEAHLFAPQGRVNDPQSGAMVGAANNLVSLGRGIGLRIILISQRPAKLHKDSLTQVETLVAMRLIAPQDRKAIDDWIGEWADPGKGKEITTSLMSLPTGTAWVWSPEVDILERIKFPLAATFDSGKAPSIGDAGPVLAPIDVKTIGERMATIRDEAAANDPARLKRQIAELQRQLASAATPIIDEHAVQAAEKRGYDRAFTEMAKASSDARKILAKRWNDVVESLRTSFWSEIEAASVFTRSYAQQSAGQMRSPSQSEPALPARLQNVETEQTPIASNFVAGASMSPSSRKLVDAIVAAFPVGLTLQVAAKRAGLSSRSSAFRKYLAEAAASPRIQARDDGRYVAVAAEEGLAVPAGLSGFKKQLPPSYARMLEVFEDAGAAEMDLDAIAIRAGVSRTSSGLTSGLRELVALELVEKTETGYRLSPDFL